MLQRLTWLGKGLVLCAVIIAAGIYVSHAQKAANPVETGYEIDLSQAPELGEFEDFINYGSPISTAATSGLGNPVTVMLGSKSISQPVFSTRQVAAPQTPNRPVVLSGSKSQAGPLLFDFSLLETSKPLTTMNSSLGELARNPSPPASAISRDTQSVKSSSASVNPAAIQLMARPLLPGSKSVGSAIFEIVIPHSPPLKKPVILSGSKSFSGPVVSSKVVLEGIEKFRMTTKVDPMPSVASKELNRLVATTPDQTAEPLETAAKPKMATSETPPNLSLLKRQYLSGSKSFSGPLFEFDLPAQPPTFPGINGSSTSSSSGTLTLPPQPK